MLEIAQAAETAAPDNTAAWITAVATGVTAFAAVVGAVFAARAQRAAAEIASSGAIRGEAMGRWAEHQDKKRALYSDFLTAAYSEDEKDRDKYDHLLEKVRLMTTDATTAKIDALGPDPRKYPPDKQEELRELLRADVIGH